MLFTLYWNKDLEIHVINYKSDHTFILVVDEDTNPKQNILHNYLHDLQEATSQFAHVQKSI